MIIAQIEDHLKKYGWTYRKVEGGIVSQFTASDDVIFMIYMQYASPWFRISVPAYMTLPDEDAELYAKLLQLNYQSRLVRFALDKNKHLNLCVDIHAENQIDYTQFEVALDALTHIAATAYPYLMNASNYPKDQTDA